MRQSIEESNRIPPDFPYAGAKEFAPLPDEFNRGVTQKKTPEKKSKKIRKTMLYLAVAGVVTLGVIAPVVKVNPPGEPPETVETTTEPSPPTPNETPTPAPAPVVLTGKIHIVVYADAFGIEHEFADTILADETFDAESFTGYRLPELPQAEGITALGYVLLAESGAEYFEALYTGNQRPRAIGSIPVSGVVTAEELAVVPLNAQGVREAEVHTVWLEDGSEFTLEFYDGGLFGKYQVGFPMYSEGLLYLAAFPTPEREGLTFAGWCDANGNIVDAVTYFDFFKPLPDAQTMEDRDWHNPIPCQLDATWSDGTESTPTQMPKPLPDCKLVYYWTNSIVNAIVMLSDREHTESVRVQIWDDQIQTALMEYELTEQEISSGIWEEKGIELGYFYGDHRAEYDAVGADHVDTVLRVALTYRLDDGTTETVTRTARPEQEGYLYVTYYGDDEEQNAFNAPGCFVLYGFPGRDGDTDFVPYVTTDPNETLARGEVCVTITVDGETIPAELCHLERFEDTWEHDGETFTEVYYGFVMKRPDSFPRQGTATVRIRQSFLHYSFMIEREYPLDYNQ
ncbi:MAG: hypothetical protein IJL26_12295 [Clostridia bacterium]|nr:hypothetical protein [Clostridia bacterium]